MPVPVLHSPSFADGAARSLRETASQACGIGNQQTATRWTTKTRTFVLAATLLGFVLRLAAAQGDLGLDEIWSLRLVGTIRNLGGILWGLSHDNNHVLNSIWLFWLGPDRFVWLYRLPAILLGTLTVPAVARWLGRECPAAGCFGAVLVAISLPFVDFGSEARGYAGLVLATVLALDEAGQAVQAALVRGLRRSAPDQPSASATGLWAPAWRLALAVGVGLFFHLAMLNTLAVASAAALFEVAARTRSTSRTLAVLFRVFLPSLLLAVPALSVLAAGIVLRGEFKIGDTVPFSWHALVEGLGGILLLTAGLPDVLPGVAGLLLALVLALGTLRYRLVTRRMALLMAAALVVFPSAVALARLPNVGYARYFAVSGVVLLAFAAQILGRLWVKGAQARRQALLAVLLPVSGAAFLDASAIHDGRGGFGETLQLMRAEGRPAYATDRPVMTDMLLGDAARRHGEAVPVAIDAQQLCVASPDWFIAVGVFDPRADGTPNPEPGSCSGTYKVRKAFKASPLSGTQWTLYHRAD